MQRLENTRTVSAEVRNEPGNRKMRLLLPYVEWPLFALTTLIFPCCCVSCFVPLGWPLLIYLEDNKFLVHINGIIINKIILFMLMRSKISHILLNDILEWMVGECFSGWKYPLARPRPLRLVWLWKRHQQIPESANWRSECSRRWD